MGETVGYTDTRAQNTCRGADTRCDVHKTRESKQSRTTNRVRHLRGVQLQTVGQRRRMRGT